MKAPTENIIAKIFQGFKEDYEISSKTGTNNRVNILEIDNIFKHLEAACRRKQSMIDFTQT